MRSREKINTDNIAVSSVIGSVLMVVITLVLSTVVLEMITTHEGPKDKNYVELVASLDLKETGGGTIEIKHKGGDTLKNNETLIYVEIDNETTILKMTNGIGWQSKALWDVGEKWSYHFSEITIDSKIEVTLIDNKTKEILLKARVQAGLSFPDYNPPIISITWCDPPLASQDGSIPFKLYATIIDSENNIPASGTVTVNLLPISGNEAEPMFDFDKDGIYETQYLYIENGTDVGTYTFLITAVDSFDNMVEGYVSLEVGSIDIISPTGEITQPTVNAFVNSTPEIIGNFADNIGGSGVDESSVSLKIDNEDVPIEHCTITSEDISYITITPMDNGIHTSTLSFRDNAGNLMSTSLSFITGGYTQPEGVDGAQNFIILDQSGNQKNNFESGEMVRIRVSSALVENADSKNRITIYDSNGNSSIIDPAFTLISNTAPYLFQDYCYACAFDAPSVGYYKIKLELTDSNGEKFSAQDSLIIGSPSEPYYFKTYSDPNFLNENTTFDSIDTVYVKIVSPLQGEVNNTNSENIYLDDYVLNHQIQSKPGSDAISNVTMTPIGDGNANYTFSIDLSKNDYGILQNANWYSLSIQNLKNQENDLIFKSAKQIQLLNIEKPDLEIEGNDISLSDTNPTLGDNIDITIIIHNIGIVNASNIKVEVREDNKLVGTQNILSILANGGDEEITIQWNVNNYNTETLVVKVDPDYSINEYDETNNIANKQVTIRYPILLVDDDDGDGEAWNVHIESYWQNALESVGYFYDMHTVSNGENGPNFDTMKNYDAVIWFSGRDNYGTGATLTSTDESNLAMYLEDGGNFWMISQSLLFVMAGFDNNAPLNNAFAQQYLQVNNRTEEKGTQNPLLGVNGDPITNGMSYETSTTIFNGNDYCDALIFEPNGEGIFWGSGGNYSAVRYDSSAFKTVFFALEFTFIVNENDRSELAEKVLDWFGVIPIENNVGVSSINCPENVQNNNEINITATINNFGKNDQNNFDILCEITAQNGTVIYDNTKILSLNSTSETELTWTWTPQIEGIFIINIATELIDDQDISDDEATSQINVLFYYDGIENGVNDWSYDGTMLTTLFYENFENGDLNNWIIDSNNDGGVVTCSDSESYTGSYCVKFYGDGSGSNNMYIEKSFDLAGKTDVYLKWYWHDEDLEEDDDGYLSIWDGSWDNSVIAIWDGQDGDHVTTPSNYEARGDPNIIKLDESYNMIDGFKIRFGSKAVHEEEWDCLLIDDITLVTQGNGNLWHPVDTRAYDSNTSFWCGDDNSGNYQGYLNNSLISPEIDLTVGTSVRLKFWHFCDFEGQTDKIDGGIVEITINNGSSWTQITPTNGYDDILEEDGLNPLGGLNAYCYDNVWSEEEFDLTPYIGNIIKLRFRFGSGATINDEGWYIDEISINRW